jgi:hypothetical protein
MTPRIRGAVSIALALLVALPLLPGALRDHTDDGTIVHNGSELPPTTTDPPDGDSDVDSPDTSLTTSSITSSSTTSTSSTTGTSITSTSTTSTSTTTPTGPGNPPPDHTTTPPVPASLSVQVIGDLIPGRRSAVVASIAAAGSAPGTVILSVDIENASVVGAPAGCTTSLPATCTFVLGAWASESRTFEIVVHPGTSVVDVDASATVSRTADPTPVEASFATTIGGTLAARFHASGFLDVTMIGNTLASCATGATIGSTTCSSVRAGAAGAHRTNNSWAMTAVARDARGRGSSSAAELDTSASVATRAFLVWGASTTSSTPAAAGVVRFGTPATSGGTPAANSDYVEITADETVETPGSWQSVADVTSLVASGGDGTYWGADIASDLGSVDSWAGWSLIVVHTDATSRDVALLDGLVDLRTTAVNTTLLAPGAPSVVDIGVVLWDGDATVTGEQLRINDSIDLGDALNPVGDTGNSTITEKGAARTDRLPPYLNTLGLDIDHISLGSIPDPALVLSAQSSGDDLLLGAVVVAAVVVR